LRSGGEIVAKKVKFDPTSFSFGANVGGGKRTKKGKGAARAARRENFAKALAQGSLQLKRR
jgi:hypothetical protein